MTAALSPRRLLAYVLWAGMLSLYTLYPITSAQGAVSDWMRGANVVPTSSSDFASASFQESMRNLRATGATSVALVIPYYQSNIYATDIAPGYNTPTDAALASAIEYLHSLGFSVMLKVHIDSYDGSWRAFINPSDRSAWFVNYTNYLVHIGEIGQQHHVELISLGTELVSMAASQMHSTNTQNWITLIQKMRTVFSGALTYTANSTNNNNDAFQNEKKYIEFWSHLDYAGLSTYYTISTGDNSVASLVASWEYWNKNDLQSFAQQTGKPLLFSEVGYRSVSGAHFAPWDWARGGSVDLTEQANDYQALFEYWNAYDYIRGLYLWDWTTNPNAGGPGSTDYTPQHKPAEQVMTQWFTSAPPPQPPSSAPVFRDTTSASPSQPNAGTATTITVDVQGVSGSLSNGIVDIEVYDSSNNKVMQKFIEGQTFSANASQSYAASWTPSATGTYRVTVGVFSGDWSKNYYWNNDAFDITVGAGGTSTPPPTSGTITEIWWPIDNTSVSGVQPLKAIVKDTDIARYAMHWSVDGGGQVTMYNSAAEYPHKEAMIDFTNWKWRGTGPYVITLTSTDQTGYVVSQRSIQLYTL